MRFIITFVFVIYCFFAFSQNAKVVGKVTGDDNKPLFGATIIYKKDITVGAHSDENGNYLLEIPEGDAVLIRSEERRVGKECRSRWSIEHGSKRTVTER